MMSESTQGKVVEAEKFVLRDSQRTVRAELGINGINSTFFALYDDDGKKRAGLVVPADGSPILELCDKEEKRQAEMRLIDAIGSASLTLGSEGAPRMILSAVNIKEEGGTVLGFLDREGRTCAKLRVSDDSSPSLNLYDKNGTVRAEMVVLENSTTALCLKGGENKLRAVLSVEADGTQGLFLSDKNERYRAKLVVSQTGMPFVGLLGEHGESRVTLAISDLTGWPLMALFDKDGNPRINLFVDAEGRSYIDRYRPWWYKVLLSATIAVLTLVFLLRSCRG